MEITPLFIDGEHRVTAHTLDVKNPWDDTVTARVSMADDDDFEAALGAGARVTSSFRAVPAHERARVLNDAAAAVAAGHDAFAALIVEDAGKPIAFARGEVDRCVATLRLAAAHLPPTGERTLPLDGVTAGEGRMGVTERVPKGLALAITPFNFPLNLVAHKVAPALASGCPVIVKPAEATPRAALALAQVFDNVGLTKGALQVVPAGRARTAKIVADRRIKVVSFTGSSRAGFDIKQAARHAHVVLELGGDAAVVVTKDTDLAHAATRIAVGAFAYAGQVCISVQRVFVAHDVIDEFRSLLIAATAAVVTGDPRDESVVNGPLINRAARDRIMAWIDEAKGAGAVVHAGGHTVGRCIAPTVVENVPRTIKLGCEEVFGPVCTLQSFVDDDACISAINASAHGLQCGVFTDRVSTLMLYFRSVEVGAVIHNDTPTFRVDHMPYGGVKESGVGREGIPFAFDDYTDLKLLVLKP